MGSLVKNLLRISRGQHQSVKPSTGQTPRSWPLCPGSDVGFELLLLAPSVQRRKKNNLQKWMGIIVNWISVIWYPVAKFLVDTESLFYDYFLCGFRQCF